MRLPGLESCHQVLKGLVEGLNAISQSLALLGHHQYALLLQPADQEGAYCLFKSNSYCSRVEGSGAVSGSFQNTEEA